LLRIVTISFDFYLFKLQYMCGIKRGITLMKDFELENIAIDDFDRALDYIGCGQEIYIKATKDASQKAIILMVKSLFMPKKP
jgi:hypothetical protein